MDQIYINYRRIVESNFHKFNNSLGFVSYHVPKDDKYEYMDPDDPIWDMGNWVTIDIIRAYKKRQGDGTKLLKQFIKSIPKGTGIIANPVPLDNDMSFEKLRDWYLKNGFKKIDRAGTTVAIFPK